ncbi:MAG: hypothetical protein ACK5QS_08005 [Pseudanabaenaceae cyanobacterium]
MEKQPHHKLNDLDDLDAPDRTISQWRIIHETQPRLEIPHDQASLKQPQQTINTTATVADGLQMPLFAPPASVPEITDDLVFGSGNLEEIFTDLFLDESVDYTLKHDSQPRGDEGLPTALAGLEAIIQIKPQSIKPQSTGHGTHGNYPRVTEPHPQNVTLASSQSRSEPNSYHRDAPMVNYEQLAQQLQEQLQQQKIQHQEQVQLLQTSFQELLTQRDELEAQLKRHIATHHALQQSLRLLEKDHTSAEKQVQDLTQEVQILRDKFQRQFGHVQDYEAHISHWKEQAVRHQHHAMQLSAALDRLLSGKGGKVYQPLAQPAEESSSQSGAQMTPENNTDALTPAHPAVATIEVVPDAVPVMTHQRPVASHISHTAPEVAAALPESSQSSSHGLSAKAFPHNAPPQGNIPHPNPTPSQHFTPQNSTHQNIAHQNTSHQNTVHQNTVHLATNAAPSETHPPHHNTNPTPPKRRVVELPSFLNR